MRWGLLLVTCMACSNGGAGLRTHQRGQFRADSAVCPLALSRLQSFEGNILEDPRLVESLESTKAMAEEITQRMTKAKVTSMISALRSLLDGGK